MDTEFHNHHALQITFATDNDFIIDIEGESIRTKSILLNLKCRHKLIGRDGTQVLLLIEPESVYGKIFQTYLGNKPYQNLDFDLSIIKTIESEMIKSLNILSMVEKIVTHLGIKSDICPGNDDRINRIVELIETIDERKATVSYLAGYVSLSESRLQHLFKSIVGISIKQYLQWKRLIDGIIIITEGRDFTFASYEAGFSDSAHMSRVFKEMFGINLREIFHNSRSIQVFFCKS